MMHMLADYTKILVVGGYSNNAGSFLDTVEAIDLESDSQNCAPVANYPVPIAFGVGAMVNGRPRVCGGHNSEVVAFSDCYEYLYETNQWQQVESLQMGRAAPGSSLVDSETWLISGGYDSLAQATETTEVWEAEEQGFTYATDLPQTLFNHCQLTINSSHVMILGGANDTSEWTSVYMLDWRNAEWLPPLPDAPATINGDACGLITNSENGQEVVVLHASNVVSIFNFRDNAWRDGPELEEETLSIDMETVQLSKTFVMLGGYVGDNICTDSVYEFDEEEYRWVRKGATLSEEKRAVIPIAVPDHVVDCS